MFFLDDQQQVGLKKHFTNGGKKVYRITSLEKCCPRAPFPHSNTDYESHQEICNENMGKYWGDPPSRPEREKIADGPSEPGIVSIEELLSRNKTTAKPANCVFRSFCNEHGSVVGDWKTKKGGGVNIWNVFFSFFMSRMRKLQKENEIGRPT